MRILKLTLIILPALFLLFTAYAENIKTVHVLVALCDNKYQAIAPVPKALGDGQNPKTNLYWGAMYGVKTYMPKQQGWQLIHTLKNPEKYILERVILKNGNTYIIADAYDGNYITDCVKDLFTYTTQSKEFTVQGIRAGSSADMLVFIGHNAFLDNIINVAKAEQMPERKIPVSVFACYSHKYFAERIKKAGGEPLILTNSRMAPEAYNLYALVTAWSEGKNAAEIHEAVSQAYHKYQKSGVNGARKLFTHE